MKITLRPIVFDILMTFAAEAAVILAFFLIYRLVGAGFAATGVGEYSLVRKLTGFLVPLFFVGTGIGLPRYVAMAKDRRERHAYLKAGMMIVGGVSLAAFALFNSFPDFFGNAFFGNAGYADFIFPLGVFLLGYTAHTFVYCYLRGRLLPKIFNLLQIVNLAAIPIAILLAVPSSLERFILVYGIALLASSLFFASAFVDDFWKFSAPAQWRDNLKELARYSFPRVGADFALFGILSLGAVMAAHLASMAEVGYLALGQSLLVSLGSVISPAGIILLPKVARLVAQNGREIIGRNIDDYLKLVVCFSLFAFFQAEIFADWIIKIWLGENFAAAAPAVRIILSAIVPYIFYVGVRDILDAVAVKSINTANLIIALAFYVALSGGMIFWASDIDMIARLAFAFSLAIGLLGILTYRSLAVIYPRDFIKDAAFFIRFLAINAVLAVLAWWVRNNWGANLAALVLVETVLALFYGALIVAMKESWFGPILSLIKK